MRWEEVSLYLISRRCTLIALKSTVKTSIARELCRSFQGYRGTSKETIQCGATLILIDNLDSRVYLSSL